MPASDTTKREIHSRLRYQGIERAGKATNPDHLYTTVTRGEAAPGRTYWEHNGLDFHLGELRGFEMTFKLWPVIGAPFYIGSRKLIMGNALVNPIAGAVWVIDSQPERREANEIMIEMFREELVECGYDLDTLPMVVQYNKRDLPDALPIDTLRTMVGAPGAPEHEAIATMGVGVFDTLKSAARLVLMSLRK